MEETVQNLSAGDWVDCAFAGLVVWGMGWGLARGLIREVVGLLAVIGAFVVAGAFYKAAHAGSGVDFGLPAAWMGQGIWYGLLWLGVWLTGKLLAWLIYKVSVGEDKSMALTNRLAGGMFGVLKGGLVAGFIAFFVAGFDTGRVPMGGSMESVVGDSRVVAFARQNPHLLGYFERSDLVAGANGQMLDFGTNRVLDYLEIEDEPIRDRAREALRPLLEDPELLARLGTSPTAAATAERFGTNPAFQSFLSSSPQVDRVRAKDSFDLADLMDIIKSPEARELFKDPGFRQLVSELDIPAIRAELESPVESDE